MKNNEHIVIADSSGIISLAVRTDSNHQKAHEVIDNFPTDNLIIIVPSEVLAETLNILGKKIGHQEAVQAVEIMSHSSSFFIVPASDTARNKSIMLFGSIPSSVSYTDCLVMMMADEYKTKSIFGFDTAFQKNGYTLP